VFIKDPITVCPGCGQENYGVVSVEGNSYLRKCQRCKHSAWLDLPKLKKHIVYIDQNGISNMMKALNPDAKGHERALNDSFWLELYDRLDVLESMQLILCPSSHTHGQESAASADFANYKRLYDHLSSGISFDVFHLIRRRQWYKTIVSKFQGENPPKCEISRVDALDRKADDWHDWFHFSFRQAYLKEGAEARRDIVDQVAAEINKILSKYRTDGCTDYGVLLEQEKMVMPRAIAQASADHPIQEFVESARMALVRLTGGVLCSTASARPLGQDASLWFYVPFNRIQCMLWAAVARKAASGMKKPPSRGMSNDVKTIAVLLPYCDAMFLDKECAALLSERPLCDEIDYGTRIFSLNSKKEFLEYLDDLKLSATPGHLETLKDVYGDRYLTANRKLFSK
jgi:hypothetical protein